MVTFGILQPKAQNAIHHQMVLTFALCFYRPPEPPLFTEDPTTPMVTFGILQPKAQNAIHRQMVLTLVLCFNRPPEPPLFAEDHTTPMMTSGILQLKLQNCAVSMLNLITNVKTVIIYMVAGKTVRKRCG